MRTSRSQIRARPIPNPRAMHPSAYRHGTPQLFDRNLVTGVILAGGHSTRLGTLRSKPLIALGGKMLLARVADVLKPICRELILVVRPGQDDDIPDLGLALRMHVVEDSAEATGPIAALSAGLEASTTPLTFVAGADHPFLSAPLIIEMLRQSDLRDEASDQRFAAVVIRYRGRLNPLHAVYPTNTWRELVWQTIQHRATSLVSIFDAAERDETVQIRTMTEDDVTRMDPQHMSLFDVDTLEDLGIARRIVDRRSLKVRPDLRRGGL